MILPAVVYQGAATPIETTQTDAAMSVVLSVYSKATGQKINLDLTQEGTVWKGGLTIDNDYPLGDYTYQLWVDSKHAANGSFYVFEGLDSETVESPNEKRLRVVQKTIDKIMSAGVSSYSVGGNQTNRTNLDHLRKERYTLSNLVNIERKAKGLPPLPGSVPGFTRYTYMG